MTSIYRSQAGREKIEQWCVAQWTDWPVAHERNLVHASGIGTHLVQAGTGEVTVVFVGGDRFSAAAYLPLLTAIGATYRLVAADLPWQPGLTCGEGPFDLRLSVYGSWLDDVVENATTGPVIVFGHSFGGAVVLSARHARIRGRVAVSSGGLCRLRLTPAALFDFAYWSIRPGQKSSTRLLSALSAPGHTPRAELVRWMTLVGRHSRPVSSADLVAAPARPVSTVVATGTHDQFLPPRRLGPAAQRILGVELDTVANAGHLVTDEQPRHLVALIDTCVSRSR